MSYLVLARKWRPKKFSEVVGQQHVLRALINGLDQNRLHHAFLFSGTRGVGKTTLARILAKSLNCEQGVSSTPCGECQSCTEVDSGRFVDLIEVDAASRTKVDDTRELLDNVQYAPSRGRYKVYLIDEVHMLSTSSFNALLKTLEEPPPHVKFLFATTDPQKLPVTILSRCLQFNLRRLDLQQISDHLAYILQQENISFEAEALQQLARAADGSMRDALSLLDQAIAFAGGEVSSDVVFQMLGNISQNQLSALLSALADKDAHSLLQQSAELSALGRDFHVILDSLLMALQQIATLQMVPDMELPEALTPELQSFAQRFDAETIQLLYQITLHGKRDINWAADPKSGFDMTLLRLLSFQPAQPSQAEGEHSAKKSLASAVKQEKSAHPTATTTPAPAPIPAKVTQPDVYAVEAEPKPETKPVVAPINEQPAPQQDEIKQTVVETAPATDSHTAAATTESTATEAVSASTAELAINAANWTQIIADVRLSALSRQLADHCSFLRCEGTIIYLALSDELSHLATTKTKEKLQTALANKLAADVKINFDENAAHHAPSQTLATERAELKAEKLQQAIESINNDPVIDALKNTFNARIIESSIKPIEINEVKK